MIIRHHTSLAIALKILRECRFTPKSNSPTDADNGLSAFARGEKFKRQEIENTGVVIGLEWRGGSVVTSQWAQHPLAPNVLHDQRPWRYFIRGPVSPQLLKVAYVRVSRAALESHIKGTLSSSPRRILLWRFSERKHKLRLLQDLRKAYRSQPCFIEVSS